MAGGVGPAESSSPPVLYCTSEQDPLPVSFFILPNKEASLFSVFISVININVK